MTYGVAAGAFVALILLLFVWRTDKGPGSWLIIAASTSLLWAISHVLASDSFPELQPFLPLFETIRSAGWVLFLLVVLVQIWQGRGNERTMVRAYILFGLMVGAMLGMDLIYALDEIGLFYNWMGDDPVFLSKLVMIVTVLLLVENLYRNTDPENRWGIRLFCLGLGAVYIFDFIFYADTVLFGGYASRLYEARAIANVLVVPLIAISASRNPSWSLQVFVSRRVIFHSISLIASGAYLIGMAAAGYYLQYFGGRWGPLLQGTFIFSALLLFVVLLSSGQMRAWLRVKILKHFFHYHFDYREEWLRFINTVSTSEKHLELRVRVIQAVADILDSPGGALWLREQPDLYSHVAHWNYNNIPSGELATDGAFARLLEQEEWIVDLREDRTGDEREKGVDVPNWLKEDPQAWLLLPLIHHGRMIGFMVIQTPRAAKNLDWETLDLLKTVGRQVASYLAEQSAEQALADAREFEAFNQKFAFVMHDIKNLASQLSLLVRNAEKHASNPDFQKDMVITVSEAVDKMNNLLARLSVVKEPAEKVAATKNAEQVDLVPLLKKMVAERQTANRKLTFRCDVEKLELDIDQEQLQTVIMHIVQNAIDATEEDIGRVEVRLKEEDGFAIIRVRDDGEGMSADFIRNELYRPFRSTKAGGYGIGAYESREMIRKMGGRMDVKSKEGEGTAITIFLSHHAAPQNITQKAVR